MEDFPDAQVECSTWNALLCYQFLEDPHYVYDHEVIKSEAQVNLGNFSIITHSKPWDQMNYISVWELNKNFRVKIVGAENIKEIQQENCQLYVVAELYHGGELVAPAMKTQVHSFFLYWVFFQDDRHEFYSPMVRMDQHKYLF